MRELHDHKINPFNSDYVLVYAKDEPDPGAGGACHVYEVAVLDRTNEQLIADAKRGMTAASKTTVLKFQHGPVHEAGANGLTDQALLTIVLDRWRAFQKSQWANRETAISITKIEEALMWQHKRTLDRLGRGVEGTSKV